MSDGASAAANTITHIPIVAVGASAGGLEPLEAFFDTAPEHAGWAYIVVQHLSPDYRSMMDELLGRRSHLRIKHIDEGMPIEPDTIYLNRPNMLTKVQQGRFATSAYQPEASLPHLPIDALLDSLVDCDPRQTAAVILSGSGSDGTKGAMALHKCGAAVLVQSPAEATFSSMPRSVLTSGAVDRVMKADMMPAEIAAIFEHGKYDSAEAMPFDEDSANTILRLLERHHHVDFSAYKPVNVERRIERRQHLRGFRTEEEYRQLLLSDPAALDELYQDLLIGVTEFYRDPDAMLELRTRVLNELAVNTPEDSHLRIWVPACASGEEAYTIAIELSEALREANINRKFRIIATDVHRGSIERASAGVYSEEAMANVPEALRQRYFVHHRGKYIVDQILRQKIIFSVHDVLSDPPFMHLDLISCRNLLIYLNAAPQARVISMFLFGLRRDGYLLLGPSESLGKFNQEFRTVHSRWRRYQKATSKKIIDPSVLERKAPVAPRSLAVKRDRTTIPTHPHSVLGDIAELRNRETLVKSYDALLKRYAPSSILVSAEGLVLSWFGAASMFIDTLNNLADWTVEEIVHPDLHFTINVGMEKLRQGQLETYTRGVSVDMGNGEMQNCTVQIEPLDQISKTRFMLVGLKLEGELLPSEADDGDAALVDTSGEDSSLLARRIQELERDLRVTEETLQHVTERLEASGEELQASNEELQASNEELQASNEELRSSNEELHAVNEELVTVSGDHERKIDLLSDLMNQTEMAFQLMTVGVLVLDDEGRIRRFSRLLTNSFQLEGHDVDRHISIVGPRLDFVDLTKMAKKAMESDENIEASGQFRDAPLTVVARRFHNSDSLELRSGVVIVFQGLPER
ncbi:MAG: CheR family methyltransferase [Pseudomonadota bacterium]